MWVAPPFSAVISDVTYPDHAKQQHAVHMAASNTRHLYIAANPMPPANPTQQPPQEFPKPPPPLLDSIVPKRV